MFVVRKRFVRFNRKIMFIIKLQSLIKQKSHWFVRLSVFDVHTSKRRSNSSSKRVIKSITCARRLFGPSGSPGSAKTRKHSVCAQREKSQWTFLWQICTTPPPPDTRIGHKKRSSAARLAFRQQSIDSAVSAAGTRRAVEICLGISSSTTVGTPRTTGSRILKPGKPFRNTIHGEWNKVNKCFDFCFRVKSVKSRNKKRIADHRSTISAAYEGEG